ncbi:isoprenylcysteine carboxylmethyltransferase family protein [Aggregatibacter segnis]|jgi:isoprenylcysteine carboxyl methyltransferase|uniref:methyltransferase family protein n=1 Tax=Aggregatibacter segnis TaxID=739 RepID=UPI002889097E|nr:isoprenylcysteine carboxylmethyltransferase family protein [Aggregatibacter segnis]
MTSNKRHIPVPPPLIFVFCALLMKFLPPVLQFPSSLWLVIVFGGMGCAIGAASVLQFLLAKTTLNPFQLETASQLVTGGVYRLSRNPMYLSLVFILLAWMLYLGSFSALLGVVLFIWYITKFQIKPEEEGLKHLFGDAFIAYCQRTRRWL